MTAVIQAAEKSAVATQRRKAGVLAGGVTEPVMTSVSDMRFLAKKGGYPCRGTALFVFDGGLPTNGRRHRS